MTEPVELTTEEAVRSDLGVYGSRIDGSRTLQALALRLAREMDSTAAGDDPARTASVAKELRTTLQALRNGATGEDDSESDLRKIIAGLSVPDVDATARDIPYAKPADAGPGRREDSRSTGKAVPPLAAVPL